jgi:hypothetical protein
MRVVDSRSPATLTRWCRRAGNVGTDGKPIVGYGFAVYLSLRAGWLHSGAVRAAPAGPLHSAAAASAKSPSVRSIWRAGALPRRLRTGHSTDFCRIVPPTPR